MVDILDAAQTNTQTPPASPSQGGPADTTVPASSAPVDLPPEPLPEPPLSTESVIPTEASGSILSSSSENFIVPPPPPPVESPAPEPASPDASQGGPPKEDLPPMDMKPKKRSVNPAVLVTGVLLLFITIPLATLVVKNNTEIRSRAIGLTGGRIGTAGTTVTGSVSSLKGDKNPDGPAASNQPAAPPTTSNPFSGVTGGIKVDKTEPAVVPAPVNNIVNTVTNAITAVSNVVSGGGTTPAPAVTTAPTSNTINAAGSATVGSGGVGVTVGGGSLPSIHIGTDGVSVNTGNKLGNAGVGISLPTSGTSITLGGGDVPSIHVGTDGISVNSGNKLGNVGLGVGTVDFGSGPGSGGVAASLASAQGGISIAANTTPAPMAPRTLTGTKTCGDVCATDKTDESCRACQKDPPRSVTVGVDETGHTYTVVITSDGRTVTSFIDPNHVVCNLTADGNVTYNNPNAACSFGKTEPSVSNIPNGSTCYLTKRDGGCVAGSGCSCQDKVNFSDCTCGPTGGQNTCYHTICPTNYSCSGSGTSAFCIQNGSSGNNNGTTSNGGTTTTTALQCVSIVAYKDGNALSGSNLANLKPGDTVTLAYAPGGSATKVRFQVNGGAWNESTNKNANSQFVWDYTLKNITSFSIAAQWFDGTNWNQ